VTCRRFVGIEPARFDEEIGQTLRVVVEWFGATARRSWSSRRTLTTLVNAHTWTKRSGVEF